MPVVPLGPKFVTISQTSMTGWRSEEFGFGASSFEVLPSFHDYFVKMFTS